jgi:hypothetical protein
MITPEGLGEGCPPQKNSILSCFANHNHRR